VFRIGLVLENLLFPKNVGTLITKSYACFYGPPEDADVPNEGNAVGEREGELGNAAGMGGRGERA